MLGTRKCTACAPYQNDEEVQWYCCEGCQVASFKDHEKFCKLAQTYHFVRDLVIEGDDIQVVIDASDASGGLTHNDGYKLIKYLKKVPPEMRPPKIGAEVYSEEKMPLIKLEVIAALGRLRARYADPDESRKKYEKDIAVQYQKMSENDDEAHKVPADSRPYLYMYSSCDDQFEEPGIELFPTDFIMLDQACYHHMFPRELSCAIDPWEFPDEELDCGHVSYAVKK